MKLYFYFLEETNGQKPRITVEECEVKEMQIFFKILEQPPLFWNGNRVMKFEIGDAFSMKGGVVVVLTERNAEKASRILKRKPMETIEKLEGEIESLKAKIAKTHDLIDAIEDWRLSHETN